MDINPFDKIHNPPSGRTIVVGTTLLSTPPTPRDPDRAGRMKRPDSFWSASTHDRRHG